MPRRRSSGARDSGLKNIPDPIFGSDRVLSCLASGRIEDTAPQPTVGSRLVVAEAKQALPENPLLIMSGGPLTTVANALLTHPEIAPDLVVFNLTVAGGSIGDDAWATYVVAKKTRRVDWASGADGKLRSGLAALRLARTDFSKLR